jgi:ABC-2 type transport system permease protein
MTVLAAGANYRLTFPRVIRSEWTKLWSLRSTWYLMIGATVFAVGLAAVVGRSAEWAGDAPTVREATDSAFLGVDAVTLVFGVFGVLMMTGEYGSGQIRSTLAAVPRRLPVLWAKAIVLIACTLPVSLVICFASFVADQSFTASAERITLGDDPVLRATLGASVAPVMLAVLGLAIGVMVRHTAGALATYVGAMLVLPVLLPAMLPASREDDVLPYVPTFAGQAMYNVGTSKAFPWMLSPGEGGLVMLAWAVGLLVVAAVLLRRRDA